MASGRCKLRPPVAFVTTPDFSEVEQMPPPKKRGSGHATSHRKGNLDRREEPAASSSSEENDPEQPAEASDASEPRRTGRPRVEVRNMQGSELTSKALSAFAAGDMLLLNPDSVEAISSPSDLLRRGSRCDTAGEYSVCVPWAYSQVPGSCQKTCL